MEYRKLTRNSVTVSRVCLGTMTFGGQTSEEDSIEIINHAIENGINFIDTSNSYNNGNSEIVTGKAIKGRRQDIILATKVGFTIPGQGNLSGLSRGSILRNIEDSLRRLDTDYIDIYYMHVPDTSTPIEETLGTMNTLVQSGKIRYYGISNHASWQLSDIIAAADKRNFDSPILTQNVYNAVCRGIEQELVPCIKHHKIGLVAYNPIAAGLLTGKHKFGEPAENTRFAVDKKYVDRYWKEENFAAVEKLSKIAYENGMPLLELAMKWCLSHDYVDAVITGVSRLEQLKQNMAAVEGQPLSADILMKCNEVWKALSGTVFKYNR